MDEELLTPDGEQNEEDYEYTDLLTLTDEDGVDHEFEVADELTIDDTRYVALIPTAQSADEMLAEDGDLVIMKFCAPEREGDDEFLTLIEDDDEFYKVSDMFRDRLSELYDIEE